MVDSAPRCSEASKKKAATLAAPNSKEMRNEFMIR